MITNVEYSPEFVLATANAEMTKANTSARELERLGSIGYMYSQTGLDMAMDVKLHLKNAHDILALINDNPQIALQRAAIMSTIVRQEIIIANIKVLMSL